MAKKNSDFLLALGKGVVVYTFTGTDGSERTMRCTRDTKMIPPSKQTKISLSTKSTDDVVFVYEVDDGAWRLIWLNSMIDWKMDDAKDDAKDKKKEKKDKKKESDMNKTVRDTTKENDDILKALAGGVINITFTKVDGSKRTMKCTRNLKKIPSSDRPKNGLSMNEDVISVYEIDNGWRSFRADSVIKWKKA